MNRPTLARTACAAALLSLCLASGAKAQTIVVTGAREPLAPDRLAADVHVIDAATIRASTADSLADLLRREAGVQLSRSGGPGQATGLLLRGASPTQTVVLVDGVRIGSATLGSAPLEGLGLSQVDRIEVLRGPGSSVYGADAVGGVVQIFTRRGTPGTRADASAAVGGYGSSELSAGVSGAGGLWDAAASVSRDASDGTSALRPSADSAVYKPYNPDDDGFVRRTAQAQLGLTPVVGHRVGLVLLRSRVNSQYDGSESLPPAFTPDNTADFRTRLETDVSALDWRGTLSAALTGSASVSRSVDDSASGASTADVFRTERDRASVQLAWQAGAIGQLVGAFDHAEDKATSSSYAADVSRRTNAAVLSLTGAAGAWSWQTDVRRDDSSDFGGVTTGRLGGGFAVAPGLRLRALAGTTFVAPNFNDLYFPGYGVPTLQPERGRSVEVGLNWRSGSSEAAATVYRNKVREMVAYESDRSLCPADPAYDFGCARNINRATLKGLTVSARHRLGAWALKAQIDALGAHDDVTGARLARRAAQQQSIGADWTGGAFTVGTDVLHLGRRPDGGKTLAAETTLDLRAGWRFAPAWLLTAKLLNATDRSTEPARDYQGLGRQAWIGLRFEGGL